MSRGKRKLSKYLCMLLSVMMTAAMLGVPVRAEEAENPLVLDLRNGPILIMPDHYEQGNSNQSYTGDYIITGTITTNSTSAIDVRPIYGQEWEYNITLRDTNITTNDPNPTTKQTNIPLVLRDGVTVNLKVEGKNTLRNNALGAGLQVSENAALIIDAEDDAQILDVTGGSQGAGIGAGESLNAGRIEIRGGKVLATGSTSCAGIGTGFCQGSDHTPIVNDILISGGTVIAKAGEQGTSNGGGAGIGTGARNGRINGTIRITGGTVEAIGVLGGAGIGGGSSVSGGSVVIEGGTVTARGGLENRSVGAGIGGGVDAAGGGTLSSKKGSNAWIIQHTSSQNKICADTSDFQTGVIFDTLGNAVIKRTGKVYGDYVLDQDRTFPVGIEELEVLNGNSLEIPMEYQLTGPGTLLNNGAVTISRSANLNNLTLQDGTGVWQFRGLTDAMLKAPNLTYTGNDLTSEAEQRIGLDSSVKEISLLNKTFQVVTTEADVANGWERVLNPLPVQKIGSYTAAYTHKTVTSERAQKTFRVTDPGEIPALESIAVTTPPTQTEFTYGDPIRFNGMVVTANYEDGSSKAGISYTVETPTENLPVGTHTITLSYMEEGVKKTCTVDIKINKKKLTWNTSGLTARDTAGSIANNNATLSGELKLNGILSADQSLVNYSAPSSKLSGKYTDTTAGNRTVNITWKNQNDIPALSGSRAGNYELPELPVTITGIIAANSSNMNTNNNAGSNNSNNNGNNNTVNNNNNNNSNNGNNNTANNNNGSNNTNNTNNNTSNNNSGTSSGNNNSSNNTNTATSSNNTTVGGIKTSDMAPIASYTVLLCASLAAMFILPGCYTAEDKARKPDPTRRYENYRR